MNLEFLVRLKTILIFSEGRDFLAFRYRSTRDFLNTKIGYLFTSVDRPSIFRTAQTHTIDYDLKTF